MGKQKVLLLDDMCYELEKCLREFRVERVLLVCGNSLSKLKIVEGLDRLKKNSGIEIVIFSEFCPNPLYDSVVKGVETFRKYNCDSILAIGGGSAIDVAKCIKLYAYMDPGKCYLEQEIVPNNIVILAIPTTAGTGSEATRYAVIYYHGEKQSVSDENCIPGIVLQYPDALNFLPVYHKKSAMMDAFCHALESIWSINSTEESRKYSRKALQMIMENWKVYIAGDASTNGKMLEAAHIAGKAINITQTTAGHAMSYKLTSLYGISHGHAVALCIAKVWPYMLEHSHCCIDTRGIEHLYMVYEEITEIMGAESIYDALRIYQEILRELEFLIPQVGSEEELVELRKSVNPTRLKNHPIRLDEEALDGLYRDILHIK